MNGKVNRAEAHQSEGGLISLYHFTLEWLRRNSALIPRSLLRGASCVPGMAHLPSFRWQPEVIKYPPLPDGRATPTRQGQFPEMGRPEEA